MRNDPPGRSISSVSTTSGYDDREWPGHVNKSYATRLVRLSGKEVADGDDGEQHRSEPRYKQCDKFPSAQSNLNGHCKCQRGQAEKNQADSQVEDQRGLGPAQGDDHVVSAI